MFLATVARCGDQPALGRISHGVLDWISWLELQEMVNNYAQLLKTGRANERVVVELKHTDPLTFLLTDLATQAENGISVCGSHGEELTAVTHSAVSPSPWKPFIASNDPSPGALSSLPAELATLQFTSGTSGTPRGVMLSQANLVSNIIGVAQTIAAGLEEDDTHNEVRLSFLPFNHLYARVCDLYCWIYRGSRLVLAESRETIFRDCQLARPTAINGVPYFYQKGVDVAESRGVGLRELLGGNIRRCYCGGAALSPALQQRYADEGIPLLNGYGLSEASPVVTVSTVRDQKPGTVGKPLPGVEIRTAEDGELLVRGPNVMLGYWNDEPATKEFLRDNWLKTGDLAQIDGEGFLTITGRKKETIVLSTGKNVSPSKIEALLAASPWIEQVAVIGDGRKFLSAIIVPNPQRVRAEIRRRPLWYLLRGVWSRRRALANETIHAIFEQQILNRLAGCLPEEKVRKFTIIPRAFSAEDGEITAKLSLRRDVIAKNFRDKIDAMYNG